MDRDRAPQNNRSIARRSKWAMTPRLRGMPVRAINRRPRTARAESSGNGRPPFRVDRSPVGMAVLRGTSTAVGWNWWRRPEARQFSSVAVLPFVVDVPQTPILPMASSKRDQRPDPAPGLARHAQSLGIPIQGPGGDASAAGRALDVAAVVTGSLSRSGDGSDFGSSWSTWLATPRSGARRTRWPGRLAALESRVTHDLAGALRQFAASVMRPLRRAYAEPQAYQAYLQGRYLWNQRSETSLQGAIARFRRAVDLDARFALAYAGLADATRGSDIWAILRRSAPFPSPAYALKALNSIRRWPRRTPRWPTSSSISTGTGRGREQEFSRAIELNPNDPVSHQWYAVYLLASGRPDRAFGEVQLAHRLDPLSLAINTDIGFHHYYNGRYAEAVSQLQSVLAMKSDFLLAHLWLARALLEQGHFDAALAETAAAEHKARDWSVLVAARGFTYAMAGMTKDAKPCCRKWRRSRSNASLLHTASLWSMPAWSDRRGVPLARPRFRRTLALAGLAPPRSALEESARRPALCRADLADEVSGLKRRRRQRAGKAVVGDRPLMAESASPQSAKRTSICADCFSWTSGTPRQAGGSKSADERGGTGRPPPGRFASQLGSCARPSAASVAA